MVKILICDDDSTFAQSMFKMILSLPAYSSKSMKLSCLTDIAEMSANTIAQYDILFLDIDLGKESGIDLARKMRKMNPEAVLIFVTNFSEYAPEGYEVDAFRYLAKSELEKKLPTYFEDALAMCRTRQRKVEILCEGESVPIPVQSLAWIESQGREQYLHLVGGCREQLITRLTMTQLEDLLVQHFCDCCGRGLPLTAWIIGIVDRNHSASFVYGLQVRFELTAHGLLIDHIYGLRTDSQSIEIAVAQLRRPLGRLFLIGNIADRFEIIIWLL